MPNVSWATELNIDLEALQSERPADYLQKTMSLLHYRRAELFAKYTRLIAENQTLRAETIVWNSYVLVTRAVCKLAGKAIPVGIVAREPKPMIEEAVLKNTCDRCGFVWHRSQPRFVDGLCSSCTALDGRVLAPRRSTCQPWQGTFAPDDITPVDNNGAPVFPGIRICGNRDCVTPKHIKKERK